MSTVGQFSSKNPTIKRILKEAAELNNSPSPDYHAAPLESDLFEWHFTIRGPPAPSAFEGGLYHGRIVLPPAYPLKPPSFKFLTPSGRFEVSREICLSISGHHEETWQPAWGIRTALVAIRSFMDTDAKGQVGGMDASSEVRKKLAAQSSAWRCGTCGKANAEIMKEQDENVADHGGDKSEARKEEVPDELRLAYREDLGTKETVKSEPSTSSNVKATVADAPSVSPAAATNVINAPVSNATGPQPSAVQTQAQAPRAPRQRQQEDAVPAWIDKAILAVFMALIAMLWYKYQA